MGVVHPVILVDSSRNAFRWSPARRPQVVHRVIMANHDGPSPVRAVEENLSGLSAASRLSQRPRRCRTASTDCEPDLLFSRSNEQCRLTEAYPPAPKQGGSAGGDSASLCRGAWWR